MKNDPAPFTEEDVCNLLRDGDPVLDEVPPGWRTVREMAEIVGLSRTHVQALVHEKTLAGKLEMRKFRIKSGSRVYPVPHYRAVSGKP